MTVDPLSVYAILEFNVKGFPCIFRGDFVRMVKKKIILKVKITPLRKKRTFDDGSGGW